jgi:hypothetical protein
MTRFIVIAWPEDHDEDPANHACDLQDVIYAAQMVGARVILPIPAALETEIAKLLHHQIKDL